ncbi:hypothetical protein K3495_g16444, partial [Podosphaera aphanis]
MPKTSIRFATIDEEKFQISLLAQLADISPLFDKSCASLDQRAQQIIDILHYSYTESAKRSLPHGRGQPWWNQSCQEARKKYREKIREGSASRADRKEFRKVTRKAKVSFFQKKIDEAANGRDVFEIAKWHKSKGTFRTPPLKDPLNPEAPPAESIGDKRNVLARNLLSNQSEVEDIPTTTPTVATTSLPFPPLTSDEVSQSILGAGNTTPGKDEIPTGVLRLAWPHISVLVQSLYQACLDMGHHPKCFRTAIVAMIGKPNKTDMASPR